MRRTWAAPLVAAIVIAASGCVGPAPTYEVYEAKAADTAASAVSAARSAILVAGLAAENRAFAPANAVAITEAERDVYATLATFASIQPPDRRSDRLRHELERLLQRASEVVTDMRVAAKRVDEEGVRQAARELVEIADRLDRFAQEHGP